METFIGVSPEHHSPHYIHEFSPAPCTAATLLSHHPQHSSLLNTWCYHSDSCTQLSEQDPARSLSAFLLEDHQHDAPQAKPQRLISHIYSPPSTESALKRPISLPCDCAQHFMNSESCEDHSPPPLTALLSASHDPFYRPQPPSPPLDTPELVQRSLPDDHEAPSPSSTSPATLPLSPLLSGNVDAADDGGDEGQ